MGEGTTPTRFNILYAMTEKIGNGGLSFVAPLIMGGALNIVGADFVGGTTRPKRRQLIHVRGCINYFFDDICSTPEISYQDHSSRKKVNACEQILRMG